MATFKRVGRVKHFRKKFIDGMCGRGYPRNSSTIASSRSRASANTAFPKATPRASRNLVYASAWIKCHYPDVFAAALLNSQPMGFYATAQLVRDAQEHGVEVRPVDVNARTGTARWRADPAPEGDCIRATPRCADDILTTHAVRLGFRQIDGFSEDWGKKIESVRGRGFDSVRDLWLRTGLPPKALEKLAHADAFNSLGLSRRDALWAVKALQTGRRQGQSAAVRARQRCRSWSPTRICRRCCRASR